MYFYPLTALLSNSRLPVHSALFTNYGHNLYLHQQECMNDQAIRKELVKTGDHNWELIIYKKSQIMHVKTAAHCIHYFRMSPMHVCSPSREKLTKNRVQFHFYSSSDIHKKKNFKCIHIHIALSKHVKVPNLQILVT